MVAQQLSPLAPDESIASFFEHIEAGYTDISRHYHSMEHIAEMMNCYQECADLFSFPREAVYAIYLHDFVMDFSGVKDNEEKSADEASLFLVEHGMKQKDVEIIREMILGTRHLLPPPLSIDAQLVADLDLVSLALPWDDFRANTEKIRQEYSAVPTELFHERQKAFLRKLIEVKPSIYLTDFFREKYEKQARENIMHYCTS